MAQLQWHCLLLIATCHPDCFLHGSCISNTCKHPGLHSSGSHAASSRSQRFHPPGRPLAGAVGGRRRHTPGFLCQPLRGSGHRRGFMQAACSRLGSGVITRCQVITPDPAGSGPGHPPRSPPQLTAPAPAAPVLTLADRPLATFLHQRLALPRVAIAVLFSVRPGPISKRIRSTRQLPCQAGCTIQPGPHRLGSLSKLRDRRASRSP